VPKRSKPFQKAPYFDILDATRSSMKNPATSFLELAWLCSCVPGSLCSSVSVLGVLGYGILLKAPQNSFGSTARASQSLSSPYLLFLRSIGMKYALLEAIIFSYFRRPVRRTRLPMLSPHSLQDKWKGPFGTHHRCLCTSCKTLSPFRRAGALKLQLIHLAKPPFPPPRNAPAASRF